MATLTNTQISVTYVGLLKTSASTVLSSTAQQITDGSGNNSILFLSTAGVGIGGAASAGKEFEVTGNAKITGDLIVDNIKIDANTISAETGVVTLADGAIATTQSASDNSTKIATTAYVDAQVTAQDLDFSGTSGTGSVDLDSQTFAVVGTANEIETSAGSQQLQIGLPNDVTISNKLTVNTNLEIEDNHINQTTGQLKIESADSIVLDATGDIVFKDNNQQFAKFVNTNGILSIESTLKKQASFADTGVELYANDVKKLETEDAGVTIIGALNVDSVTSTGGATFGGTVTTSQITSSGNFTIDSALQIILDGADDGSIQLKDDGTLYGLIYSTSDDFYIKSTVSDGDIIFQGNDGGVGKTVLTLDMSENGNATFAGEVKLQSSNAFTTLRTGNDFGWSIYANSSNFLTFGTGAAANTKATDWVTIRDDLGYVGINETSPSNKLQISDSTVGTDSTADDSNFIKLTNKDIGTANEVWGLGFSSKSGATDYLGAFVQALGNFTSNFNTSLIFGTRGTSGNATERMRINSSGKVGIGETAPAAKLDVKVASNEHFLVSDSLSTVSLKATNDAAAAYVPMSINGSALTINADSGGNVGIGTASPGYRLSVANASTRIVSINYQDSINTIMSHAGSPNYGLEALTIRGDYIAFYTDYDVSHYQGVERMRITSAGQVNIHPINDTSETLRVFRGTGAFASQSISIDAKSGDANIRLLATDTARSTVFYRSSDGGSNFTESMRIGSNGNIAQANTSPIADPFVNGAEQWMTYQIGKAGVLGAYKNNNESMFGFNTYFSAPSGVNKAIVSGLDGTATRYYADRITFNTLTSSGTTQTQTERMRITSGGNINIGSGGLTQTAYQLRVDSDFDNGIYLSAASGNDSALYIDNGAGTAELFIVRGDGNIKIPGIGVTTGATAVGVDSSGFIRKLSSSKRYKKDIESIDIGLDFINSLSPVKFKMKEDDVESVGLIAEDMIDNRFVTYSQIDMKDESKGLQVEGVNYQALIAPLIKSIQELKAEIELLKSK